jgi:[acyl-carrier-protein] S-malonyltransferase
VIAGEKEGLDFCLKKAQEIGAIGIKPILTVHPYHTSLLKGITHELHRFLKTLSYSVPSSKILSLTDGATIGENEVIDIIVKEIYTPLHFDLVVERLIHHYYISVFYETGPPESMRKLLRYIHRGVKVHHLSEGEVR